MTQQITTTEKDKKEGLLEHTKRAFEYRDENESQRSRLFKNKTTKQKEQEYLEQLKTNPDLELPEELLYTTMTGMNLQIDQSDEEYPTLTFSSLKVVTQEVMKQIKYYPDSGLYNIKTLKP
jgi:hypothetical protein